MKIILSRKGFDAGNGKIPSPILPNGELLSLPIHSKNDKIKFADLTIDHKSYYEIIKDLKPNYKISPQYTCHLDPDIKRDLLPRKNGWRGLFGQSGAAQGHLRNNQVAVGDLFIFYGWFKQTENNNSKLRYVANAPDLHVIYGYLQIGKIYNSVDELPEYARDHPHANRFAQKNNCLYEASEFLSFANNFSGSNYLRFSPKNILTKNGYKRSYWALPDFFKDVEISYHTVDSFTENYFNSAKKGQEFIITTNAKIINYFKDIILQK